MGLAPDPSTPFDDGTEPDPPVLAVAPPVVDPDDFPDWWVCLGEKRWPFRLEEVTAAQARLVRLTTGQSRGYWIRDVIESGGTEVDSWAVVCWMARMQNGEPTLTLAEVEEGLTYGSDFSVKKGASAAEDPDSPEA